METFFEGVMNDFVNHVIVTYLVTTVLLTFLVLSYIITKPNKLVKILVHFASGLVLGLIWYFVDKVIISDLVLTFCLTYVAYSWVVKTLCDKFNLKYDNGVGINSK